MPQQRSRRPQAQPGRKRERAGVDSGPARVAWFAGLGAMAAFELIEWPLALIIGVTHVIETTSRDQMVEELAGGVEAGV